MRLLSGRKALVPTEQRRLPAALLAWLVCGVLLVAFLLLRLAMLQPSADVFPDSDGFVKVAKAPLLSPAFWAGERPAGLPLFYKLVGLAPQPIFVAQLLLAAACWGALGVALAASLTTIWLRPLAFALVQAFSLSRDILQWDLIRHSESLASSLFALLCSLLLLAALRYQRPASRAGRYGLLAAILLVAGWWAAVRDTNAYFLLGAAGLLALGLLLPAVRRSPHIAAYLGVLAGFGLLFALINWSADLGGRWKYPLVNSIGKRILIDEQRTAFFAARGMPTDRRVMRYRDQFADAHGMMLFRNNNTKNFRDWLDSRGKRTYLEWLASRPFPTLAAPLAVLPTLIRPPNGVYGEWAGVQFPAWVAVLSELLYTRDYPLLLGWSALTVLLALLLALLRSARPTWLLPAALLLLLYPLMLVVFHGDAMEIGRHSHLIGIQLRLANWLLLILMIDVVLAKLHARVKR